MSLFSRGRDMIARVLPEAWVNEAFSLYRRTLGDTFGAADACNGKRGVLSKTDARVGSGLVAAGTIVFLLDASTVTSAPRAQDKIVGADSLTYHIDRVELVSFDGSFWRCEVTKGL